MRAVQGEVLEITLTTEEALPAGLMAVLATTLNTPGGKTWGEVPFVKANAKSLSCHVTPRHPGMHSLRATFSLDDGSTWVGDTVPDAFVLIDPPQVDGLRIYTLIPTVSGNLEDWAADLTRIAAMGFNAIHLLPITALDTTESPYAANDLFDIDQSYLTPGSRKDDFKQLQDYVANAKDHGIRLCFDLVLNHIGVHSKMARRAPDWIVPDPNQADGLKRARYWTSGGWRAWNDLALINYEHPSEATRAEIWAYMKDYVMFWASFAKETGGFVRFDNLHSSNSAFVRSLTRGIQSDIPEVAVLAEYFTDESTLLDSVPLWGLNLILATPWNYKFVPELREYLNYIHRVSEQIRYFMPITSHDSGSPDQEFGTADSTVPRYVAAALMGTGATGMPEGVECGELRRIDFIGRQARRSFDAKPRFAEFVRCVNSILVNHPAFRRGQNCQFVDGGHPSILAALRTNAEGGTPGYLVVCNFDIHSAQSITIDLTSVLGPDGPFRAHELLGGEIKVFTQARFDLQLPPCGAWVLEFFGPRPLHVSSAPSP